MIRTKTEQEAIEKATKYADRLNEDEKGQYYRVENKKWLSEVWIYNEHSDVIQIYQY